MKRKSNGQFKRYETTNHWMKLWRTPYWIAGLYAADGCIKNNYVSISQSNDHGKKLVTYLQKLYNHTGNIYKYKKSYQLQVCSESYVKFFKKFNVIDRKTYNYELPKIKENENFKSFIRGYFEGDGSIGVYSVGGTKEFLIISFVGTNNFIKDASTRLEKLGFKFRINHIKRCKNLYEIRFTGKEALKFGEWLFENVNLYRSYKYDIFKKYKRTIK